MKKHIFKGAILMLIAVAVICSATSMAFAAEADNIAVSIENISPRYIALKRFHVDLSISSSGYASCSTNAVVSPHFTVEVIIELQKRDNGWTTIKSQSSNEGVRVDDSMSCYVSSGSRYRVKGTARVYDSDGKLVETAEAYSAEISY